MHVAPERVEEFCPVGSRRSSSYMFSLVSGRFRESDRVDEMELVHKRSPFRLLVYYFCVTMYKYSV